MIFNNTRNEILKQLRLYDGLVMFFKFQLILKAIDRVMK